MAHRILSLHIESTSNQIKSYFVLNRAISANLGDKRLYYVRARDGEGQNYFPCRGDTPTNMTFYRVHFFRRQSWRIKLLQPEFCEVKVSERDNRDHRCQRSRSLCNFIGQKGTISTIFVSKGAKIRNRYNQVPHLTQDTNGKVTN